MATRFTATIQVRCEKEHTCAGCGAKFAYTLARSIKAEGNTAEAATATAQKKAVKAMTDEVDLQPCPTCGIYQPDMLGSRRAARHLVLFWIAAAALAGLLIVHATDLLGDDRVAWLAAGAIGLTAVFHWLIDSHNPNQNREGNRGLAEARLAAGVLRQLEPGRPVMPEEPAWEPRRSLAYPLTLMLLVIATVLAVLPEIARRSSNWPLNAGWYPPVAGPGDETYLYLPQSVQSVKGFWRGSAAVTAKPVGDAAAAEFPISATSNQGNWGGSISVKSGEKDSRSRLWVRLHLPNDPQHAGQAVECRLRLAVTFPKIHGGNMFAEEQANFEHTARLAIAAPHAGSQYRSLWWGGVLGGGGLLLVISFARYRMARGLQRQAQPTRILVPAE